MISKGTEIDPVAKVAEEFLERYRRGEHPSATEYSQRYPELADRLREVLPMMVVIEQAGVTELEEPARDGPSAGSHGPPRYVEDYRILREIGKGGMGVVYEAEQLSLGRLVALKFLSGHIAHDARLMERFRREARAAAQLHHTNIVPVFDVGQQDGICYYAMQRIHGQPLDQVLAELRQLRAAADGAKDSAAPADVQSSGGRPEAPLADTLPSGLPPTETAPVGSPPNTSSGSFELQPSAERPARTVPLADDSTRASLAGSAGQSTWSGTDSDGWHYYRRVAEIGMQVAGALAYAHQEEIIHRDIKPSNLLLDAHGTVWITDFGLAKHQGDDLTHTGDVVGTLRYMAPERFRGTSDGRSDVYSLGITLYEMLAMGPAFESQDRLQLIQQITRDGPPRLRAADSRIPADLETIVLTAIERDPKDRYQSAAELEADLQRFLDDKPIGARRASQGEQFWRWCRRNPAVATLTGVIGLLLVALTAGSLAASLHFRHSAQERERISILAVDRERQAQRNLQTATEAINRFFVNVSEDSRLKSAGLETLRRDLLETSREFFAQLARYEGDDPELLANQAHSYLRLAMINGELGFREEALAEFGEAERILEPLVLQYPEVADYRKRLSQVLSDLGNAYRDETRYEEAEAAHRRALALRQQLLRDDPEDREHLSDLCDSQNNLGIIFFRSGRRERAEEMYKRSLELRQRLSRMAPDDPEYRLSRGKVLNNLGVLYRTTDRAAEAESVLQQAVSLHRTLVDEDPKLPVYRYDLALSLNNLGLVFRDTDRVPEAIVAFQEAIDMRKDLADVHSDVPSYQMDTACSHCQLAMIYWANGDLERAAELYEGVVASQERLADAHPQTSSYLSSLASHHKKLGNLYKDLERYDDAVAALARSIDLRERLIRTHPEKTEHARELGGSYRNLAATFRQRGELKESLLWYEQAISTLKSAQQRDPRDRHIQRYLLSSFAGQAAVLHKLQRYEDAIPAYEQVVELGQQLASDSTPEWLEWWHANWDALANCYVITVDSSAAEVKPERIERLVARLAHPALAAREAASRALLVIGKPALDALERAAAESEDLEFRDRAAELAIAVEAEISSELHRFEGHADRIISVAFSSDGRRALSGGGERPQPDGSWLPGTDFSVRLWDVPSGEELQRFEGHRHAVMSVALSPDGRHAVSGGMDKTVRLWDVETGEEVRQFLGHGAWVWSVAFSPDGRQVLSAGTKDKTARLWDTETGEELQRLEGHTGRVLTAAFSPDGQRVITSGGDDDPSLRLWDVETGDELRRFNRHEHWVWSVAFSPDGRRILSGSVDETMRLWDVETGEQLRVYRHGAAVRRVAFSPDGRRALTGNGDATLRLWELESGTELRRFHGHRGLVEGVALSPQGRFALSSGYDRTLRLWRLPG